MKVFALSILIAVLGVSALAQSKSSGIEGVWQLTEITTSAPDAMAAMAMPDTATMATSAVATKASVKETGSMTMKAIQPGMYLFTKTHYSIIYVQGDKPREEMENYGKATQEQLLSIFVENFVANAGTYEVKNGKLTVHPTVAKSPAYMKPGTWSTSTMKISGNTMTLTSESSNFGPIKNGTTYKLTRVE